MLHGVIPPPGKICVAHEHGALTGAALPDLSGYIENMNIISNIQVNHDLCSDKGLKETVSLSGIPRAPGPFASGRALR
jgi:hypothetical protein